MSEKVLTPTERAKLAKEKDAERMEAMRYQFPKGNGVDPDNKGHHGKVFKCLDTTTEKKGTPVWEMHVTTKEVNPKGKKVDIVFNFWKSDKALDFLYKALEQAGADLSSMPARTVNPDQHDLLVNKCFEALEDVNSKIRFSCAHTVRPADPSNANINYQKEGININYYLREFGLVDGKLPLVGVLAPLEAETKAPAEKAEEKAPVEPDTTPAEPTDSAFADDDD
jgi:hypothetical protein